MSVSTINDKYLYVIFDAVSPQADALALPKIPGKKPRGLYSSAGYFCLEIKFLG